MNITAKTYEILTHYREKVNPEMNHYYGIIAVTGLVNLAGIDREYADEAKKVLGRFPDGMEHPHYNFPSYRVGGIAKARAVYDGLLSGEKYDSELRFYAEELMNAKRSADGILSMPYDGGEKKIWIDVATAVTPFLLFAGLRLGEEKYINEAVFQTLGMYDIFMDKNCGLLHQSRGFCGENKLSEDHWSRGNGWGIYPLSLLCEFLPDTHPKKDTCVRYFRAHLNALAEFVSPRGLWRQEITVDSPESYEETSGSGLILAAVGTGIRLGLLDEKVWKPTLVHGIQGLLAYSVTKDCTVLHSCPGCLCPEDGTIRAYLSYKPSFPDEPHGAGPIALALTEAAKCGIEI